MAIEGFGGFAIFETHEPFQPVMARVCGLFAGFCSWVCFLQTHEAFSQLRRGFAGGLVGLVGLFSPFAREKFYIPDVVSKKISFLSNENKPSNPREVVKTMK